MRELGPPLAGSKESHDQHWIGSGLIQTSKPMRLHATVRCTLFNYFLLTRKVKEKYETQKREKVKVGKVKEGVEGG